jgi:hypothetical protein
MACATFAKTAYRLIAVTSSRLRAVFLLRVSCQTCGKRGVDVRLDFNWIGRRSPRMG